MRSASLRWYNPGMSMPIETKRHYTVSEYLQMEEGTPGKLEYRNGEIIAMAGASYDHTVITANVTRRLAERLDGKPCRVSSSDLRVKTGAAAWYVHPDVAVVCGAPQFDVNDGRRGTVTNPRVVVEVLSPSTEGYDRGEKFSRYRETESLQDYVLIRQDAPEVNVFHRRDDGTWLFLAANGLDARIALNSIGVELLLKEIYAGIEFPPRPEAPQESQDK